MHFCPKKSFQREELFAFQKKVFKNKNCLLFKKNSKEMFACFSRKGFQVWIQMRKNLRCARMLLGLKNWKNIYLERLT